MRKVYFTKTLKEKYPEFKVSFAVLKDIHIDFDLTLNDFLKKKKEETERFIRENLSFLLDKTNEMNNFFKMLGAPKYPIKSLLEATAKDRPIKLINPLVDIVLFAELTNSILMGLHDLDKIEGDIFFDVLENPQEIKSLFGGSILLQKNDIVIKDDAKIFASLLKGPDIKTKVTKKSKNIIIFTFLYPSEMLQKGKKILKDVIEEIITVTKAELVKISDAEEEI